MNQNLIVKMANKIVGELNYLPRKGIYFSYHPEWILNGFNLSPLNLDFSTQPQLALNSRLFSGLHGVFSDSLPDGWGMLLMDRYFAIHRQQLPQDVTSLERLAYMGNRAMGALEYIPSLVDEEINNQQLDLYQLYQSTLTLHDLMLQGQTNTVLEQIRIEGGSPGGARPKLTLALSPNHKQAISAYSKPLPHDYQHWLVKFHGKNEHKDSGVLEYIYAQLAKQVGLTMTDTTILNAHEERFFATQRFDRQGENKKHMLTVAAMLYADYCQPCLKYTDLLALTMHVTKNADEVEKMAQLMVFNALMHNQDDHAKNFSFLYENKQWRLSPPYDLTYSKAGFANEHTTAFYKTGIVTQKEIILACETTGFDFLKPLQYIEQTLDVTTKLNQLCIEYKIDKQYTKMITQSLNQIWQNFKS